MPFCCDPVVTDITGSGKWLEENPISLVVFFTHSTSSATAPPTIFGDHCS